MISITELVRNHIRDFPFVEEALLRRLINLSALGRELKPKIEKKLTKSVKVGSIVMALKRISYESGKTTKKIIQAIQSGSELIVRSNLFEYTYLSSQTLPKKYLMLSQQIYKYPNAFFTLTKGLRETTLIVSANLNKEIEKVFQKEKLISKIENLSSITITYTKDIVYVSGYYYFILKLLAWEGINIVESVSAFTEFTVIVDDKDVDRAFGILKRVVKH